jgi:hypothetical protein
MELSSKSRAVMDTGMGGAITVEVIITVGAEAAATTTVGGSPQAPWWSDVQHHEGRAFMPFGFSPNSRLISDKGICPGNLLAMRADQRFVR